MKNRLKEIQKFIYIVMLLVMLEGVVGFICDYIVHPVKESVTIEAGKDPICVQGLLKRETDAHILCNLTTSERTTVGQYPVQVVFKGTSYLCNVKIVDTTAPTVTPIVVKGYTKHVYQPNDFIKKVEDASPTKTTFNKKVDFSMPGKQTIVLKTVDTSKNITLTDATMILEEDKEAPVLKGVKDINLYIGKTISYKKHAKAIDKVDGECEITVDSSKVNIEKKGDYKATYSATDISGNTVSKTVTVHVKNYDLYGELEEMCEKTIDKIIKDNMTTDQKIKAIYSYCVNNLQVSRWHEGTIQDYKRAAYYGFKQHRGDCTTYAGMMMSLLEAADITDYKLVKRYPINVLNHYWLLINNGKGYYHYDPYRSTYKMTDAKLDEKGSRNPRFNYYQRQKEKYPSTPKS